MRALAARPDADVWCSATPACSQRAATSRGRAPRPRAFAPSPSLRADEVTPGKPNDASGQAQLAYLTKAVDAALAGEVSALVTAPISKE